VVMGIRSSPKLDPSSNVVRVLIDMYVDIGDHIALQYGGSEAHKKVSAEQSESIVGPIGKVRAPSHVIVGFCFASLMFLTLVVFVTLVTAQRTSDLH
jgi:hypothetical protein